MFFLAKIRLTYRMTIIEKYINITDINKLLNAL